ncbi:MAG: hypothetical protein CMH52_14200 [Myxococcales bacterium]|nr:hypothetical protein [Myxococcales bacterium]
MLTKSSRASAVAATQNPNLNTPSQAHFSSRCHFFADQSDRKSAGHDDLIGGSPHSSCRLTLRTLARDGRSVRYSDLAVDTCRRIPNGREDSSTTVEGA